MKNNRYNFVTTFADRHKHGIDMVKSWLANVCDKHAILHVYYEGDLDALLKEIDVRDPDQHNGFVMFDNHPSESSAHFKAVMHPHESRFVSANINSPEYDIKQMFKMHASRFCHKIFAIDMQMLHCKNVVSENRLFTDYVCWIDADTIIHSEIPEGFFDSLVDDDIYMSYLARTQRHSECGFLMFNTQHRFHNMFWNDMLEMYDKFKLIHEKEWHDSYIFDVVRHRFGQHAFKKIHEIDVGDVFGQSVLGKYMTHFKGPQTSGK